MTLRFDLVAMDDVSMLTNYGHSDRLIGEGRGLCQRFIHRNIAERNAMLPYSNEGLKIKMVIATIWLIVRHETENHETENQTGSKNSCYFLPNWLIKTSI